MWRYWNPVEVRFGAGVFATGLDAAGPYGLVTYGEPFFAALGAQLAERLGPPAIVIDDVLPNPDCVQLSDQCARFRAAGPVDRIIALGGGSVIDTAKVLAAGGNGFDAVLGFVLRGEGQLTATPITAIPTTAGTGSEVTCWATIWDEAEGKKYSLAHPSLYPQIALVDPKLTLGKSVELTRATGLDALSHALESLWNKNANPVSARHAVSAARSILTTLPRLLQAPEDLALRSEMAEAALGAGLAFSNTKTAIAHNISYPITLNHGVPHGIACSFTLPTILRSVAGLGGFREAALRAVFDADPEAGAASLAAFLKTLGVAQSFTAYGITPDQGATYIELAFAGERGRNFAGDKAAFDTAARAMGLWG